VITGREFDYLNTVSIMILAESFIGNPKIPEESDGMEIDLQSIS